MKEADRKKRNETRLLELFPTFRARIERVIITLESQGLRPRIQDAWRSKADQLLAVENGTSLTKFGFHNITALNGTKEALAVDLIDDNSPMKSGTNYLLHLAAAADAEGVITGIRWGLPDELIRGVDAAIAAQDWDAKVKVGWDPAHVEPIDVTINQAKAGARPV